MNCKYCGQPAGLFHRYHAKCLELHEAGRQKIWDFLKGYLHGDASIEGLAALAQEVRETADKHFVTSEELHSLAIAGFESAVDEIVERQVPSDEEESKLRRLQIEFGLTQAEVEGAVERLREAGRKQISDLFRGCARGDLTVDQLTQRTQEIVDHHYLSAAEVHSLAVGGFQDGVDAVLDRQLLSQEEETKFVKLQRAFALTQSELGGAAERLARAAVLRDLDAGVVKPRMQVEGLSINLLKNEIVLWLFNDVKIYELKTKTSYVGGSHGVSVRILKGLYYRVGAFEGHRVQTQDLVQQDVGSLIVTNQNVYFSGPVKSMRIRLTKIVSVRGYSDGIELVRESANPKPLVFKLDDPWFASNLILKVGAM
jgi:hypothetical protein